MYHGQLECADCVRDWTLPNLPHFRPTNVAAVDGNSSVRSLDDVSHFDTLAHSPIMLMDTSSCPSAEEQSTPAGSRYNAYETAIVVSHVDALVSKHGLRPADIAVISPYNGQVECIKSLLRQRGMAYATNVRSMDGFQGGEREAVILSLVRSNPNGTIRFLRCCQQLVDPGMTNPNSKAHSSMHVS